MQDPAQEIAYSYRIRDSQSPLEDVSLAVLCFNDSIFYVWNNAYYWDKDSDYRYCK